MHPQVRQTRPGSCPICGMGLELASAAMAEEGPGPRAGGFHAEVLGRRGLDNSAPDSRDGPVSGVRSAARGARRTGGTLDRTDSGHAGGAVERSAVPRARLDLVPNDEPQHVLPDRDGSNGRLAVQRGRRAGAGHLSGRFSRCGGRCRGLFRSGGGDRDAGAPGSDHGTPCPPGHRQGHPRTARHGGQDCACDPRRRPGGGDSARPRATR